MVTTIGFGDIIAQSTKERAFALFLMLFGVSFYTFTIGNISSMLSNNDLREQKLIVKQFFE